MADPFIVERGTSYRRYLLLKFHAAMDIEEYALAGTWRAQHDELAGSTALPAGFPFLLLLQNRAYTAWEDLYGATVDELVRNLEVSPSDAQAIIAAHANLAVPS